LHHLLLAGFPAHSGPPPMNGHCECPSARQKSAISGLMHRSKANPIQSRRPRGRAPMPADRGRAPWRFSDWYLVGVCTGRSAGFAPALISAIMGHAGAAPTSVSSSSKARTKLPGGPRRGLGLSQIGRQMPALLSFTFLDLKCGSASSRAVPPV